MKQNKLKNGKNIRPKDLVYKTSKYKYVFNNMIQ